MAITFETFLPPESAKEFVMNFWFFESDVLTDSYIHHSTASVFPRLIFGLDGNFHRFSSDGIQEKLTQSGLTGQTDLYSQLYTQTGKISIFGVMLFPHSVFRLTGYPAEYLNNTYPDLDTIWHTEGTLLEEQVMMAPDHTSRIQIISNFLKLKWDENLKKQNVLSLTNAVSELSNLTGTLDLKNIANKYSLSLRQFERNFKSLTGFSPKYFNRISRFEKSTDFCLENELRLVDIAYHFGYFDQSHFIKDFKQFSGQSPSSYQQKASSDIVFVKK